MGLFGSLAHGEQNDSSDIDLVIKFKPVTTDLYSLQAKLRNENQSQLDRPVDICRLRFLNRLLRTRFTHRQDMSRPSHIDFTYL